MVQLGHRIKNLREKKGLSQVELAKKVKVNNSLICKIETGQTDGSIRTLKKIATVLEVSLKDLLEDDPPAKASGE